MTNSLTGIGEALLDSVPLVAIVGDVAQGEKYRPFQVHCLDQVALLKPVTKGVFQVEHVSQIAAAIRQAFALAMSGEPGPVAVVIPYKLLIESARVQHAAGRGRRPAVRRGVLPRAIKLLKETRCKVGIYAGLGCMDYSELLVQLAELLQAPVATSVSGKGVIPECHPLAVGWGYGPHATGRGGADLRADEPDGARSTSCWPSACGSARSRPASTTSRRSSTSFTWTPTPSTSARWSRRTSASTPTRGCSCRKRLEFAPATQARAGREAASSGSARPARTTTAGTTRSTPSHGVDPMAFLLALRAAAARGRAGVRGRDGDRAPGGRGVPGLQAADLLQPDRQPGDGLVDPGGARGAEGHARPPGGRRSPATAAS